MSVITVLWHKITSNMTIVVVVVNLAYHDEVKYSQSKTQRKGAMILRNAHL